MPQSRRITTDGLTRAVKSTHSFKRFCNDYSKDMVLPALSDYLTSLCAERGVTAEQTIKRSQIDRVYGHQIFSGMKRPSRDKVLQIAFGFGLSIEQAQTLLKIARKSPLYPRVERDAAIMYCLGKGKDVMDAQVMLAELGLPIMGDGSQRD